MTAATKTNTEAAPLSVEEMTEMLSLCPVTEEEHARAIATAAGLERLTNWIVARERAAGKDPIQALKTVREAFEFGGGSSPDPTDSRECLHDVWKLSRSWAVCTRCGVQVRRW
jgi:hypothetical protein